MNIPSIMKILHSTNAAKKYSEALHSDESLYNTRENQYRVEAYNKFVDYAKYMCGKTWYCNKDFRKHSCLIDAYNRFYSFMYSFLQNEILSSEDPVRNIINQPNGEKYVDAYKVGLQTAFATIILIHRIEYAI